MADVVFLAAVGIVMALAWLLVRACDRLLGPDDPGLTTGPPATSSATPVEPAPGASTGVDGSPAGGPRP